MTGALVEFVAIFALEVAVMHVFFRWIEGRMPKRLEVDISHISSDERARTAKRANRLGTLACIILWPIITGFWAYGFYRLQLLSVPEIPNAEFVRLPTFVMHGLPAIFAGIVLTGPAGMLVMRLVYGRRFREVMAVGDAQFRFDVRAWMYATFVLIVPFCVDLETLWLGRYMIFTDEGIHSRATLARKAVFHPYGHVKALYALDGRRVVHGDVLPDRRFCIEFQDGEVVPSLRFAYHDGRPEDFAPLRLAQAKSGVRIQWVQELP